MTLNLLAVFQCEQYTNSDCDCTFSIAIPFSLDEKQQVSLLNKIKENEGDDFLVGINGVSDLIKNNTGMNAIYYNLPIRMLPVSPQLHTPMSISFSAILVDDGSIVKVRWFKTKRADVFKKIEPLLSVPNYNDFISFLKESDKENSSEQDIPENKFVSITSLSPSFRKKILSGEIKFSLLKIKCGYTLGLNNYNSDIHLTLEDFNYISCVLKNYLSHLSSKNMAIINSKEFIRKKINFIMSPENILAE